MQRRYKSLCSLLPDVSPLEILKFLETCRSGVEISNFDNLAFCSVMSHILMQRLLFHIVLTESWGILSVVTRLKSLVWLFANKIRRISIGNKFIHLKNFIWSTRAAYHVMVLLYWNECWLKILYDSSKYVHAMRGINIWNLHGIFHWYLISHFSTNTASTYRWETEQ